MGKNRNLVVYAESGDLAGVKSCLSNRSKGVIRKKCDIDYRHELYGATALHLAASKGHLEIVSYLADKGANMHVLDKDGKSALHKACESNSFDVVTVLVDKGIDINIKDHDGRTALHKTCFKGGFSVACYLVQKGANITLKDEDGRIPLHWSCYVGYLDITKLLLEKGSYIEEKDKNGRTPLHLAAKIGYLHIVKYLLEKGADINAKDTGNRSPYQLASNNDKGEVCKFLLEVYKDTEKDHAHNTHSKTSQSKLMSTNSNESRNSLSSKDLYSKDSLYSRGTTEDMISTGSYRATAPWVPDNTSKRCMLCDKKFTIFFRRHHCRRCGILVCKYCAPSENITPIPEHGYINPVRHCKSCFRSPYIKKWKTK